MMDDSQWFVEPAPGAGYSIGLRIRKRLERVESPYQTIEIFETDDFGRLMAIDGCIMLTERDHFIYHEMLVHPALLTHPRPQRIVIVGGGDCGTLTEVLKHPEVESAIQVEIDPAVTTLARQHFPELALAGDDPRAVLHYEDALRWIERAPPASIDILCVDSTDPVGPAQGLFETEFYINCRTRLKPDGILALQSESPFLYPDLVKQIHGRLAQAGFRERALLPFSQPTYPSGVWSVSLASTTTPLDRFRSPPSLVPAPRYYSNGLHRSLVSGLPALYQKLLQP